MANNLQEIRDRFFTQAPPLPRESVTFDNGLVLDVVGLSFGARAKLMKKCMAPATESEDGETVDGEMDLEKMQPELIVQCTVIPGTTERIFNEADLDALNALPSDYLDKLMTTAAKLSGLKRGAQEEAKGNSEGTVG